MRFRTTIPKDTSRDAWDLQVSVLDRLGPEGRVKAAIELSEFVRAVHLAGIRARNPQWSAKEAIRHLVATRYGVDLPGDP